MANCIYLQDTNGNALTCPETSPDSARCQICLLLLILNKNINQPIRRPVAAKLPS